MSAKFITVDVEDAKDAIDALRYAAHDYAAHSQAPALFTAEDTIEWEVADRLQASLDDMSGTAA